MTASRVLNNCPGVSAKTRERVLRATKEIGYVPNASARNLASGRSRLIGVMAPQLSNDSYFGEILRGVGNEINSHGYHLVLNISGLDHVDELSLASSLMGGLVGGLLMVLPNEADSYLELLTPQRFPCVLIDHHGMTSALPRVQATNYLGALEGTRHLIQLGHRRIGFITGRMSFGCAIERLKGYQAALQEANILGDPQLIKQGDFSQYRGVDCATELLAMQPRPTAIFASNDLTAFGVYDAARSIMLRIPEDLSILGFDDIQMAALLRPALTTVRQPLFEMGRQAVRMLIESIEDQEMPQGIVELPTQLVVRLSTASPQAQTV